ncbi:MAG: hypothetical protein ACR2PH_07025, partial [Desulfobulbia bacterium]
MASLIIGIEFVSGFALIGMTTGIQQKHPGEDFSDVVFSGQQIPADVIRSVLPVVFSGFPQHLVWSKLHKRQYH